jgi:hypothetical protein
MRLTRFLGLAVVASAFSAALVLTIPHPARGTDLQDSQTLVNHPAADITDIYAFPAPDNVNNVVLVMNTNPLIPSGQGPSVAFDPSVLYQFHISHGNPGVEDEVIQFVADVGGTGQHLRVYGPAAPNANSASVSTVVPSTASGTIPYNRATQITVKDAAGAATTMQVFAGSRSDPDFFDLSRFYAIFPDANYQNHQSDSAAPMPNVPPAVHGFTGFAVGNPNLCDTTPAVDFFSSGRYNVLSIVIEMPKTALAAVPNGSPLNAVNIWATTSTANGV